MKRKLLSLLMAGFFFFQHRAHADTFVVTSNADSGPGTLREAITLANTNGTSVTDTILFSISNISRAGRTIIPATEFPELTSNIIIDGSSQAGDKIGTSDARIILLINTPQSGNPFTFFKFNNVSHIEFYGLFLFNEVFTEFSGFMPVHGIVFTKSSDIIIGKPGKGNYFRGLRYAVNSTLASSDDFYLPNSANITVQSNVFNNDETGDPSIEYNGGYVNPMQYALQLYNTKNIKIGGDLANEGNIITAQYLFIRSALTAGNGYLVIKNNFMGIRTDGNVPDQPGAKIFIIIRGDYSDRMTDYDINIARNKINGRAEIYYHSKYLRIQGNKIFDTGGNGSSINYNLKLLVEFCSGGGIIGGDLPEEQNEVYTDGSMMYHNTWSSIPSGAIWVNVSPNILMRKNRTYCSTLYGAGVRVIYFSNEPHIQIDSLGVGFVRGKATPNCKIEVFLDDDCWGCDGIAFLGQTLSSPDSLWSFSGNFNGVVIATATRADSSTSGYTEPTYRADSVKVVQPTCGMNNGSITGMKLIHSWNNVEWHKNFIRNNSLVDTIISTGLDIINLEPGFYYFVAKLGETCRSAITYYQLRNFSPRIDETNANIINPTCGQFNGSIYGLNVIEPDYSKHIWVNEQGVLFPGSISGSNASITNLPPGRYRLIVRDTVVNCADTSDWYDLVNQAGPSINTDNIQINSATCNNSNGSITSITSFNVTGTPFIQWLDSLNNVVGNMLDLLNQPAGKYKMKFKDQSLCDTIITPFYIIPATGRITIDTAGKIITKGGCTINNGSIRNIKVIGADTYQWQSLTTNTPAGNTIDIYNLSPGNYQLTATNAMGCSAISPIINVPQSIFIPIGVTGSQTRVPSCGQNNGMLRITSFNNDSNLYSFRWIDSASNQQLATGTALYNIGPGTYLLMATDSNGCEKQITKSVLGAWPKPTFDLSGMSIKDDKCARGEGGITGIRIKDFPVTVTYTWKNTSNIIVGNALDLLNVPAGQYYLTVTDGILCTIQSDVFTVANSNDPGIILQYDDQMIQRNTGTTLTVRNFQPGTYFLYSDPAGNQLLQQNITGVFATGVLTADADYYIKFVTGACASSMTHVKVTVVDRSFFAIASAFTPNNDGRNDRLDLKVIGYIDVEYFRIFNRNGEEVFSTKTINQGWDGKYKGTSQTPGVFVWMAKGKDINGKIISSNGTFVLIR